MTPALRRTFLYALERGAAALWLAALWLSCAWSVSAAGLPGPGRVVQTEQVRAELIAHAPEGIAAGRPMWLGLRIDHAPGWHTYWKNPGDSGLPTELIWQLPPGHSTGEIVWPTPRPLPLGSLMNFGYEGTLVLPVPLTVPEGPLGDTLPVRLQAQWLVCKDVCIPEDGTFAIDLPTRQATGADAALFDAAFAAAPAEAASVRASAQVQADAITVTLTGLPGAWVGRRLHFMPETPGVIDNAATPTARWEASTWQARVALSPQRSAAPQALPVVLTPDDAPAGVRVALPIEGVWPPLPGPGTPGTAPGEDAAVPPPTAPVTLWAALLLALAGGLLLNLMPCVFPVLALKVVGFATHGTDRRGLIAGGLAYTAGVIASFIALAGLLLALRAGGEQLGWGFQLQSPAFVAALAALFTLIGLNLVGVFEFGQVLPGPLAAMRARHPTADSALTGVLAVAVASPCTAPFMGASLGLAVSLPAPQALSVFAALGLGMALPYLIASVWPAFARALPRPGAWMAWFKGLMAFPMFATVIWLLWVLGQQSGIDAVAGWLGVLLALGMASWVWGGSASARTGTRRFARAGALATLALTVLWAAPGLRTLPPASAESAGAASGDTRWQAWSAERAVQALAQGRPVFVDYTAAWCVTCQYNKRTTLSDPQVLEAFARKRVLLLRADWTRRDPEITAALTSLGRNGVPVYALTAPGDRTSRLLGEILSVREVLEAVDALP